MFPNNWERTWLVLIMDRMVIAVATLLRALQNAPRWQLIIRCIVPGAHDNGRQVSVVSTCLENMSTMTILQNVRYFYLHQLDSSIPDQVQGYNNLFFQESLQIVEIHGNPEGRVVHQHLD